MVRCFALGALPDRNPEEKVTFDYHRAVNVCEWLFLLQRCMASTSKDCHSHEQGIHIWKASNVDLVFCLYNGKFVKAFECFGEPTISIDSDRCLKDSKLICHNCCAVFLIQKLSTTTLYKIWFLLWLGKH